jgi:hypothetical protein
MGRRIFALVAAAALVAASAAFARGVFARSVALAPNTARTLNVGCPGGSVALSGGVQAPGSGTTTLAVSPSGTAAFAIRVGNPGGNSSQHVTVATVCRALTGGRRFRLTHVQTRIAVPAHGQKQAALACTRGTLAASAGFDLVLRSKRASTPLELRRQTQTLRRFSFLVRNNGSPARRALLSGTCATVIGGRLQLSVTTTTTPVQPGSQVAKDRCQRGWFSVATGYALPASVSLSGSAAVTGGGRWTLANSNPNQALAQLQLVCGRVT